jgi:anti-repressor protein
MNDLIQVEDRRIGDDTLQTVNARELHAFLEVGKHFGSWIQDRIQQFNFSQGVDFEVFPGIGKNSEGRPAKEYALTLDMAKELSMVERNDKGKQARQYFIECERRAKTNVMDMSTVLADPAKLRTVLLAYTERVMALEAKVQEQAPKAQFHDAVTKAINCQSIQEIAKVLDTGPNRLFKFLREEGLLMCNNLPYQQHLDAGHFRTVERQYSDGRGEVHTYTRTLVTGKGLAYIQRRIQSQSTAMQKVIA